MAVSALFLLRLIINGVVCITILVLVMHILAAGPAVHLIEDKQ